MGGCFVGVCVCVCSVFVGLETWRRDMPTCPICQKDFDSYSALFQHKSLCNAQKDAIEAERLKREKEFEEAHRIVIPEEEQEKIRNWKFVPSDCKAGDPRNSVEDPRFYHHIQGGLGSDGVLVIERTEGDVVIVKPVAEAEGEIFSSLLFCKLVQEMGQKGGGEEEEEKKKDEDFLLPSLLVKVPKIRPLHCKSSEFEKFCTKLKLLEKYKEGGANQSYMNRISQKSFLLVIEFMRGDSIYSIGPNKFFEKWNEKSLAGVGMVIALDMLINNWDRFPVPQLWENEGNPGNLMILQKNRSSDVGEEKNSSESPSTTTVVVAIDQSTTPIVHDGMREKYFSKVRQMIEEPDFSWFAPYIQSLCGVKKQGGVVVEGAVAAAAFLSDEEMRTQVRIGFKMVIDWIAQNCEKLGDLVEKIAQETEQTMKEAVKTQDKKREQYTLNLEKRIKGYEQFLHEIMKLVAEKK